MVANRACPRPSASRLLTAVLTTCSTSCGTPTPASPTASRCLRCLISTRTVCDFNPGSSLPGFLVDFEIDTAHWACLFFWRVFTPQIISQGWTSNQPEPPGSFFLLIQMFQNAHTLFKGSSFNPQKIKTAMLTVSINRFCFFYLIEGPND